MFLVTIWAQIGFRCSRWARTWRERPFPTPVAFLVNAEQAGVVSNTHFVSESYSYTLVCRQWHRVHLRAKLCPEPLVGSDRWKYIMMPQNNRCWPETAIFRLWWWHTTASGRQVCRSTSIQPHMLFAANGLAHGTVQLVSVLWTALCIVVAAGLAETVRQCTIIRLLMVFETCF